MELVKQILTRFIIMIMIISLSESNTGEIIHKCDFESDMCGWMSRENDTFKWKRTESANKANNVVDFTREGEHFIFMNSANNKKRLFVNLTSPVFNITDEACLSLWYYTSDDLKHALLFVFQYNTTVYQEFTLKEISKSTASGWKREQVNIVPTDEFKISITADSSAKGNVIAVDDIKITTGSCPHEYIPVGYIGCFEDNLLKQKLHDSESNNGEECRRRCESQMFKYAGTKKSYECYCGSNTVNSYTDGVLCNMTCPGNEQETCGGTHSISLYSTSAETTTISFDRKMIYIFTGAGVGLVLLIFIIVVIIRRRMGTSRKIKSSTRKQDSTNPMANEDTFELSPVVTREEKESNTYTYITLDTVSKLVAEGDNKDLAKRTDECRDGANTYHSVTLETINQADVGKVNANFTEQTYPCGEKAYSHVSPIFTMKKDNTYDHIQDVTVVSGAMDASGEDKNNTTHINNIKQHGDQPGTSGERWYDTIDNVNPINLHNKPDDDYSHLNHDKRTEPLTTSAGANGTHNETENKYEHFVERNPDTYLDIKLNTGERLCINMKPEDENETKDSHTYYTLEVLANNITCLENE